MNNLCIAVFARIAGVGTEHCGSGDVHQSPVTFRPIEPADKGDRHTVAVDQATFGRNYSGVGGEAQRRESRPS